MVVLFVSILIIGYVLISTEMLTNINKAAVAIFMGTVGWVIYICYGADFVSSIHNYDYFSFLAGAQPSSTKVKEYIASNLFLPYVARASEIVLFLLSTMTIVEILNNNGCFNFIGTLLRKRNSRYVLWVIAGVTFIVSANLDNFTTTMMMLTIMHQIIPERKYRLIFGSTIIIAANCGGALTVIGSPTSLVLWNKECITATSYSAVMFFPCLIASAVPIYLLSRKLPRTIMIERRSLLYRVEDTRLSQWQRVSMLFVGIGGLWFIPTFHNITKLSPFLGALCVLSVLWVVNEISNRHILTEETILQHRFPRVLQYGVIQMILYVMGIILALGVAKETGLFEYFPRILNTGKIGMVISGIVVTILSCFLDNFLSAMTFISSHDVVSLVNTNNEFFAQNGVYWDMIAYASAIGGNLLCFGSISGIAFIKMEKLQLKWFFRHVTPKVLLGAVLGFLVICFLMEI